MKKISFLIFLVVFIATWIKPIWVYEQSLHSSLTIIALMVLWFYHKKYAINERDFALMMLFLTLHTVAGYWLYSNVPYERWSQSLFGVSLNEFLGWERNNFDRLIHLFYGICITPFIISHFSNVKKVEKKTAFWIAIGLIVITSVIYEWLEWLVAISLSPHDAEAYNGQQGDMWDAHKDMLLATLGGMVWYFKSKASDKTFTEND
ncbi:MAG: DUF2238 domain-containing protein [Sulfurovum sp.]|nr:MAG: DUF2238 domain-containing protein [Sulfurovum sp.]